MVEIAALFDTLLYNKFSALFFNRKLAVFSVSWNVWLKYG